MSLVTLLWAAFDFGFEDQSLEDQARRLEIRGLLAHWALVAVLKGPL